MEKHVAFSPIGATRITFVSDDEEEEERGGIEGEKLMIPVVLKDDSAPIALADIKFIPENPEGSKVLARELRANHLPVVDCQEWYADQSKQNEETMKIKSADARLVFYGDKTIVIPLRYASTYRPTEELFVGVEGSAVSLYGVKRDSVYDGKDPDFYKGIAPDVAKVMKRANTFIIDNLAAEDSDTIDSTESMQWKLYGDVPVTVGPHDLVTLRCESCLASDGIILEVSVPAASIASLADAGLWQGNDGAEPLEEVFDLAIGPVTDVDLATEFADVQNVGKIARLVSKTLSKLFRKGSKASKKASKKATAGAKKVGKSGAAKGAKSLAGEAVTAGVLAGATTLGTEGTRALINKTTAKPEEEEELEDAFADDDDESSLAESEE